MHQPPALQSSAAEALPNYLDTLNEAQRTAAVHGIGPAHERMKAPFW